MKCGCVFQNWPHVEKFKSFTPDMRSLTFLFALLIFGMAAQAQTIPIPKLPVGHSMGNEDAKILLEVFIDELCPDCKAAYPNLETLQSTYGGDKLNIVLHSFPLPYHRASFFVSTAAKAVTTLLGEEYWLQFTEMAFKNQDALENPNVFNKTDEDVYNILADWVTSAFAVSKDEFLQKMADPQMRSAVVMNWKWGAARGVSGTPTFFVNGVRIEQASPDWTYANWKPILDPLL